MDDRENIYMLGSGKNKIKFRANLRLQFRSY